MLSLLSPYVESIEAAASFDVDAAPVLSIQREDEILARHFGNVLGVDTSLSRVLVSFQASKNQSTYRWFKYKEAFSAALVETLLANHAQPQGRVLDPFSGSGTALFAASIAGYDADGIELLPIGREITSARLILEHAFTLADFGVLERWIEEKPWQKTTLRAALNELRITQGAYPPETLAGIESFMAAWLGENARVQSVLRFALLCVLESVSYTRKDGQYLRWDFRSNRRVGARPFNKGAILNFDEAITTKLREIISDARGQSFSSLFENQAQLQGEVRVWSDSCLTKLPQLATDDYDAIMTSPPYCNRYDYTRTYALELALLGISGEELVQMRQEMLSCTVENRAKDLSGFNPAWKNALEAADDCALLQAVLGYLDDQKTRGLLNNSGIARMVRGYFYEMACVIFECARVLKPGAPLLMVNDNVRYAGASISVDLILSFLAEKLGFEVEKILVLPGNKGNSSQQMGEHGREALRKCVYVWRKL